MSIYQIQEQLRGLPDDALLREMQQPSGAAPQYLILTEIERRQQLRRGAQAAPSTQTVAQELAQGLAGIPSLPQGPAMPGGQMPAQMPPGADAGIAAMQQPQGFAEGGEVDGKGKNMFEQGMFGSAFPMKGLIDWAAERWDQKGPLGFGLISLLQDGFTNDPKKGVMDDSGDVTPETSINSNMTPASRTYSGGGEVEDDEGSDFNPIGMFGGVLPMIADGFMNGNKYGSGILGLMLNKRKPWESGGESEDDMSPEGGQSMNSNMTPMKAPVAFAGGDLVLSPTPILRNMIYGIESMGGKDLNSIASGGKYIGPGQMNAASYADAARYAKKLYPEMNFPSWNNKWVGSPEGKRPKDYPNKSQWNALTEGYIEFSKDMLKRRGIPVSDATVYGAYNLGIGNLSKLFSNPNSPMSEVLSPSVVSQNKFNPNFKWSDVVGELGRRLGKDVAKQPSKQPSLSDTLYGMIPSREDISAVLARFAPQAPKPDATSLENIRPRESYASPPRQVPPSPPTTKMIDRSKDPYGEGMVSPGAALPPVIADMMKRKQAGARADDFESILNRITGPNPFPNMAPAPRPPQPQYQPEMMQRPKDQPDEIGDLIRSLNAKRDMAQEKRKKRLGYAEGGLLKSLFGEAAMKQKPAYLMSDFDKLVTGTDRAGDYASPDAANDPYDSSKSWLPAKYYFEPTAPDVTSPRFRPIKGLYDSMYDSMMNTYGPDTFGGAPIFPAADTETETPSRSLADIYAELEALGKAGEMSPELKGLFNELKRDKQQEMWLSLAQFGAALASGQSPYFAENLGNATKAGIQTLIEGDRAAKGDISAMINATLMDQQNRDVNRRNLISTASDIYRSDQEYRRAIETAKIALKKAQESAQGNAKNSPQYKESVSIDFEQKVSEAADRLMEKNEGMTREEARAQVFKDMAASSNFARTAGIGISSIRTGEDSDPVALELRPGQQ